MKLLVELFVVKAERREACREIFGGCDFWELLQKCRNIGFSRSGLPIAHGEGCYFADEETLAKLKANNQILWQYCDATGNLTDTANRSEERRVGKEPRS